MQSSITNKAKQFMLLLSASIFCVIMLLFRQYQLGISKPIVFSWDDPNFIDLPNGTLLFLVWNLILAWVPYIASLLLQPIYEKTNSKTLLVFFMMIWLCFLPNAPYIITDFVHLKKDTSLPFWYDITVLFTFAGIGLMLGLLSLLEVEKFLRIHIPDWLAKLTILFIIPSCGLGIWVGRYQRWNSWDLLTRPDMVIMDIYLQIKDPIANMDTLGLSIILSIMILFSYLMLQSFQDKSQHF